jgi:hypothetical protein
LLYSWTDSQSGFTVFAFALVTAAFVWVAASVAAGYGLFGASGAVGGTASISPGAIGAMAGGGYSVGSTIFGGGGPITSAQQDYLGATGSGFLEAYRPANQHEQNLTGIVIQRHIDGPLMGGLRGVAETVAGDCSLASTTSACAQAGRRQGSVPRPDSVGVTNPVPTLRERYSACQSYGLRGTELLKCAASNRQ